MRPAPRVLIIADDLTGAMDSAGPFACLGVETWVVAEPTRCDPASLTTARVVSINTDTRHLPAAQAAARVAGITRQLGAGGFDLVVKKIDSTLRGNVVAETLALREASARGEVVVAAAFPAQGRTVQGGMVYVDGKPLAQTGFAHDALSPPPLIALQQVFAAAQSGLRVALAAPTDTFGSGADVWIADSQTDADLARIAQTLAPRLDAVLMVGSAGLTRALARICFSGHAAARDWKPLTGTLVFAVGSRAQRSAEQVQALAAQADTRVLPAPDGRLPNSELPRAQNLVIQATTGESGQDGDAAQVAAEIARQAIQMVQRTRAQALIATGGDTAIAILNASGNPALQVLGDLMPGIPYARIQIGGSPVWFITKAGGFGGHETFRDLARKLREG